MSDEIDFEFDTATFDELRETLEKVAKKYPDYAEKELKKEIRKETNKRSDAKHRSFLFEKGNYRSIEFAVRISFSSGV